MYRKLEYIQIYCWNSDYNPTYLSHQIGYWIVAAHWPSDFTDLYKATRGALQVSDLRISQN
jgi:hypothetical protein